MRRINHAFRIRLLLGASLALLSACDGTNADARSRSPMAPTARSDGGSAPEGPTDSGSNAPNPSPGPSPSPDANPSPEPSVDDAGAGGSQSTDAGAGGSQSTDAGAPSPPAPLFTGAADLAAELGLPAQLLVGVKQNMEGVGGLTAPMDIRYVYLVGDGGAGSYGWPTWNNPPGRYVDLQATQMHDAGSLPMFTLYSMAAWGDGNLVGLQNTAYMTGYWNDAKLLFERLAIYGGPAMVQLEPDFWGYANLNSGGNPANLPVMVGNLRPECADLPNDVSGMAQCLILLARTYAPQVRVGLHASVWGDSLNPPAHAQFLVDLGASQADFFTVEMLDRDAGCYEAHAPGCTRNDGPWYWDVTNATTPNFDQYLSVAQSWQQILQLPLVLWQVPMGVPSATPGGSPGAYRDNRVQYLFAHPEALTAIGGLAMIYGEGASSQTTPATDDGQFNTAATAYATNPQPLPTLP